ncbi:MAG: helix-turn-helix domain-containing protein [Firmicutes bacterium]|nr:helix-turn-helix domain-containing protein [Bacillota bacterium]
MKNKLPERLKKLRADSELSQAKLAVILNMPQQTYDKWEQGRNQPSIEALIQLSAYYDVSIDYLIGTSDNTNKAIDESCATIDNKYAFINNSKISINQAKKNK